MRAFGAGDCAREWACASLATCYFSSNPRHFCAHVNETSCAAAFDRCGVSHIVLPDVHPALAPAVEGPARPGRWVDPATPTDARRKRVNGEELVLVFSDEFANDLRDLGPGKDAKWEAVDLWYDGAEGPECCKPEAAALRNGSVVLSREANVTYVPPALGRLAAVRRCPQLPPAHDAPFV